MSGLDSASWEPAREGYAGSEPVPGEPARHLPSRLFANLYLLLGIGLLIVNSRIATGTLGRYTLGIALEVVLALLALLFMRLERLDIRSTARFRRAEPRAMLLALAAVPGLWVMGIGLNLISTFVLGYTTPVPPTQFPSNALQALALALTTMVAAPICEEIMFRGYVQRAYERRSIWTGLVVGGLIFALYHLRFQGVFALIPVALGLGFVAWRTRSIYPAMLMHAAFNAIATVVMISTSFLSAQTTGVLVGAVACLGLLAAPFSLVALWLLWKGPSTPEAAPVERSPARGWRWAWIIPALVLAGVYAYAAVSEVTFQRFPESVLDADLDLVPPAAWEGEVVWTYTVQNRLGSDLGTASCSRRPREAHYVIACEADYAGFDISDELPGLGEQLEGFDWSQLPFDIPGFNAAFSGEPRQWTLTANWAQEALALTALDLAVGQPTEEPLVVQFQGTEAESGVVIRQPGAEEQTLPVEGEPVVMLHEWAWRFSALPFQLPYGGHVTVVEVDPEGEVAVYPGFLRVAGGEPAWTPAGNYIAWRVSLTWEDGAGQQQVRSAWYEAESPHTLVRYDDGIVSYLLESIELNP